MAAQTPESDAEYEYKTINVSGKDFNSGALQERLNTLATDGWVVEDTFSSSTNYVGCVLRRERSQ